MSVGPGPSLWALTAFVGDQAEWEEQGRRLRDLPERAVSF